MSDGNAHHDEAAIKAFFDQWKVYDVLVTNDYMEHGGILRALRDDLAVRKRPFSIVDLGCGDASRIADALKGLPIQRYVGVDLSSVALARAATNLARIGAPAVFYESDFVAFLESPESEASDVVITGFAAHHLNTAAKGRFLGLCSGKLKDGGSLYYYDVFRRPGETRERYFAAYIANLEAAWVELSPGRREQTKNHIITCDRPETFATIAALARKAGFAAPDAPLFQDDLGFHRLYCLRRRV